MHKIGRLLQERDFRVHQREQYLLDMVMGLLDDKNGGYVRARPPIVAPSTIATQNSRVAAANAVEAVRRGGGGGSSQRVGFGGGGGGGGGSSSQRIALAAELDRATAQPLSGTAAQRRAMDDEHIRQQRKKQQVVNTTPSKHGGGLRGPPPSSSARARAATSRVVGKAAEKATGARTATRSPYLRRNVP